jgi:osmotically-inducible protein OsmY
MQCPVGLKPALQSLMAVYSAGCATQPRSSETPNRADALLAAQVQAALHADRNLYARHIDVIVERGVAQLDGIVWSDEALQRAQDAAASVPGVVSVKSYLEVTPGGTAGIR